MGERRILLYGDSVVLGSVGASLGRTPQFELIHLETPRASAAELEAFRPDVILFDIENGHPEAAFCLLESDPDLLLLGISPDVNLVRLWTGRQYSELSADALAALAAGGTGQAPKSPRKDGES
ncbi:MAG TPA: hypothetical protein VFZ86_10355 [Thermoleophilia bacterium]|nr:hypothetical protein [Thermoleophilia bacterium]